MHEGDVGAGVVSDLLEYLVCHHIVQISVSTSRIMFKREHVRLHFYWIINWVLLARNSIGKTSHLHSCISEVDIQFIVVLAMLDHLEGEAHSLFVVTGHIVRTLYIIEELLDGGHCFHFVDWNEGRCCISCDQTGKGVPILI